MKRIKLGKLASEKEAKALSNRVKGKIRGFSSKALGRERKFAKTIKV